MSELTQCNLCTLNDLKRKYKQSGKRVMTRKAPFLDMEKGVDVYLMPRGESLPYTDIPEEFHSKYWICWLGEVSKQCAC